MFEMLKNVLQNYFKFSINILEFFFCQTAYFVHDSLLEKFKNIVAIS